MSLADEFQRSALALVGTRTTAETLLRECFRVITVSPLKGAAVLDEPDGRRLGDIALRGAHVAVYIGSGWWVRSGLRTKRIDSDTAERWAKEIRRPATMIEVPMLRGGLTYFGLVIGSGRDVNKVKAFCADNHIPFTARSTSPSWAKFLPDAAEHLAK